MGQQGIGDHLGGLAPGAGTGHGQIGSDVAVLGVGRDLHDKGGQLGFRQSAVGHGGLGGSGQQRACLVQCSLPGVVVLIGLFKFSHWSDSFHSLGEFSVHMGHGHFQAVAAHKVGAVGIQQVANFAVPPFSVRSHAISSAVTPSVMEPSRSRNGRGCACPFR